MVTGLALVEMDDNVFNVLRVTEIDSKWQGEYMASKEIADIIVTWLEICPGNPFQVTLAVEDFVLRRSEMTRSLLSPIRMTMLIAMHLDSMMDSISNELAGQPFPIRSYSGPVADIPVVVQQPSAAKRTFTNERMKLYGIYNRTKGMVHARDAVRHAALALFK